MTLPCIRVSQFHTSNELMARIVKVANLYGVERKVSQRHLVYLDDTALTLLH